VLDERLAFALRQQLLQWRAELATDAERVGWKIGRSIPEAEEFGPLLGHLTTETRLEPGAVYRAEGAKDLRVDAEVAVEIGPDGQPAGFGAALELVDLGRPPDDLETIVAANLFHRAFVLGPSIPTLPPNVEARIVVNGEVRGSAEATPDPGAAVERAALLLAAAGERLEAGDRIITGAVVQVPVAQGDEVVVDLGELGQLDVRIR
jgi:2-keto-4-pentenoate hydratase